MVLAALYHPPLEEVHPQQAAGGLLRIGVGRLDALGRDISELRDEVRSILIRNGKAPNFQMEIKAFNSKKAYITTDTGLRNETDADSTSAIIPITDQGTTFRELMAASGIAFDERRLTLIRLQRAEALFAENGPLATETAQRSAVYLLRGRDPVQAYHLDAQNPLRVLVADAVELRPNDIVFVAEQPITTFNRTLTNVIPVRVLFRDIRDNNLP